MTSHCHYCGVSTDRIKQLEVQLENANLVARHEATLREKLEAQLEAAEARSKELARSRSILLRTAIRTRSPAK